ncbi:hypothetical protein [Winogradskya humida]|uniref:Helix-turn-helix domain containing protein n=1 Tax=Winogradskya humida TaxID=113566 RepID=A0ABQ3ZGI9_9ACTN|nr:hypothetical protein [Actinoplanes humidus]GIE17686.1 hypothetical protein Ahu01nite_007880 [Actinoplanes humidus]
MNDIEHASEHDRRPHTMLERHLTVGAHTYQITATGTGEEQVSLVLAGWDPDGKVVSQISGGISPHDLPAVADALTSTLAGLAALRVQRKQAKATVVTDKPRRYPNRGARWSDTDDDRLLALFREGATERALMEEFGRSRGGIRARLESLGELESDTGSVYRERDGRREREAPPDGETTRDGDALPERDESAGQELEVTAGAN